MLAFMLFGLGRAEHVLFADTPSTLEIPAAGPDGSVQCKFYDSSFALEKSATCAVAGGAAKCSVTLPSGKYVGVLDGADGGRTFVTATAAPVLLSDFGALKSKARVSMAVSSLPPSDMEVVFRTAAKEATASNCVSKEEGGSVTLACSVPDVSGSASVHFRMPGTASEVSTGKSATVSAGEPLKIGFILVGPTSDFGWNYNHNLGRLEMMAKFGGLVETVIEENVDEWGPNVCPEECTWQSDMFLTHRAFVVGKKMIEDGAKMIFGTSFWFQDDIMELAKLYPDVKFVFSGAGYKVAPNVAQVFPKIYQARYLAGIVAAQRPEVQRTKRVGFISAFRLGETIRAVNAFKLGLEKIDPEIKVLLVWQFSWFNDRKERLIVERLVKHHGISLIMQHTDSTAPQITAGKLGIEGIGYNGEMLYTVGDSVLASTIMDWGSPYISMVQSYLDDEWEENLNLWIGSHESPVSPWRIPEMSPRVSAEERAVLTEALEKLKTEDDIFCAPNMVDTKGRPRNPNGECLSPGEVNQCCHEFDDNFNCLDHWLLDGIIEACSENPGDNELEFVDGTCFVGPLDIPDLCPMGQELTMQGCTPCPAGTVGKGDDKCLPCPEGTYAPEPGMEACLECEAGTFTPAPYEIMEGMHVSDGTELDPEVPGRLLADLGTYAGCLYQCEVHPDCVGINFANIVGGHGHGSACTMFSSIAAVEEQAGQTAVRVRSQAADTCQACPAGSFSRHRAATCTPCQAGSSIGPDETECSLCKIGTYAGEGASSCTTCPRGFSTLRAGAEAETACTCEPGTYWNRRDDACEPCPAESFCAGGHHLPVVYEGYYARYMGTVGSYEDHEAAGAAKRAGTYKKDPDAFYSVEVYKCSGTKMCPGKTLSFELSAYGVESKSTDYVHYGHPLPGACPTTDDPETERVGIACARCQDDHYGTGKLCKKCEGGGLAGAGVLMFLAPFIMLVAHKSMANSGTQRLQAAFVLVSTCGMAAFFMQTIAVLDTFAFSWPSELDWLFMISRVFMFDLQALSVSCMHSPSFLARYWASVSIPMAVVGFTAIGFGISMVMPEAWRMRVNTTFSMLGMLFSALYITLVKVVVAYFECNENPAAKETLAKYRDVVCGSGEHQSATAPMAIGLVLYMIGFYTAFVHAAYAAPSNWMNVSFRERWNFMLTRWRPDTWFWGCNLMTRNLLVAFGGIVSSDPRVQLVYVVVVVTAYFAFTGVYQPWRASLLNHFDVATSIVLCFIGMFGLIFVALQDEVDLLKRFDQVASVGDKEDQLRTFAAALTVLISIFMALVGALFAWCFNMMLPSQAQKTLAGHAERKKKTMDLLESQMNGDFVNRVGALLEQVPQADFESFFWFLQKLAADVDGSVPRWTFAFKGENGNLKKAGQATGEPSNKPAGTVSA